MGLMGLGGLLAIVGGLLFVVVVVRAMRAGRRRHGGPG
jgi:cytochrome c oxidase subunit 1